MDTKQSRSAINLQQKNAPVAPDLIALFRSKNESFWMRQGERAALRQFHDMARNVPAYEKFLKKHRVKPESIRTIQDFQLLPETNKKNYIAQYDIAERSPGGTFEAHRVIAVSSGTTGAPTLWPRGILQEEEAFRVHEALFLDLYEIKKYKTLAVIGFPMGIYVSGMATTLPTFLTSIRHRNFALLTAGNNKESILSVLPKLQRHYEQIVLIGHPFFVKDVIETGKRRGISWGKTKVRTFFCSEGFSEEWRSYLGSLMPKIKPERDLLATYGSSELLLMGYETPETVLVRKYAGQKQSLRDTLFNRGVVPSLFQYNPALRYIEANANEELLFTARSGIPLIRYNMHDAGFVMLQAAVKDACQTTGIAIERELKKIGWKPWNLPYVALYGRNDHTLIFYAVNIYPEHVHLALNHRPFLRKITGKFRMEKTYHARHEQKLVLHIELQQGLKPSISFEKAVKSRVTMELLKHNMEYADASARLGKDLTPKIILHNNGDSVYFKAGLKPRYIQ